ncbi:hypothetical protein [Shewanella sp. Isolate8]|uniref:hypothetical protein n=1 Tax=Shewanella sp. Isolate8 TaxID=2908529 RepID=UPI001EFC86C5|nr:hypothetical protein [Shewanella sp. Isolate8]MCG9745742.1 hypothetical protein [Shewanella sp. Isolate8]
MSDENDKMLSDAELKALYLAKATEQPSSELDARILAMAQARLNERRPNEQCLNEQQLAEQESEGAEKQSGSANVIQVSFWRRYRWPMSTAASVLLLSSLLLMNLNGPNPIDEQVRPMLASEPQPMRMTAPPEQQEPKVQQGPSAQADVDVPEMASPQAVTVMSRKAPADLKTEVKTGTQPDEQAKLESLTPNEAEVKTQAKAVISDIQAVNHLQQLVDAELWPDANTLYQRLLKERPRLEDSSHPQHSQWRELVNQIKAHRQDN